MKKNIININKLYYSYNKDIEDNYSIYNINLNIFEGEKIAILGKNGAGKTTLMKLICNLYTPNSGDLFVDNININSLSSYELSKKIGYVFQNPDDQIFLPTVKKEILYGHKEDEEFLNDKNIKEITEICGIDNFLNTHPHNLPWSYRKFISIATIMVNNPDVFIFDEPTAGQDIKGIKSLENIIDNLHNKNKTIITITHDMDFAARNFNRIIIMKNGQIVGDGIPSDIFYNTELINMANLKKPFIPYILEEFNSPSKRPLTINDLKNIL